ncbi:MAG: ABC transporter permease, partial [candidate division Zixibacteria bacterium]|nr:ABC transporter permease [candidate division Zixibacteria bacterium]
MEEKASVAYPAGPTLKAEFPEVLEAARLYKAFQSNPTIRYGDNLYYEENFFFADSTIFNVFSFEFVSGNPQRALHEPNTIVISENLVRKYFANANSPAGYDDPVGKVIHLNLWELEDVPFKITAVCRSWPKTSHFEWDLLASFANYHQSAGGGDHSVSWYWEVFWTYILLPDAAHAPALAQKLPDFVDKHYPDVIKKDIRLSLRPLTAIHLHSDRIYEIAPNSNIAYVYIFATAAIAVLLLACVNFVNLSTARSTKRAREIGMRKVLGAGRPQLIGQFLGEAVLTCIAALLIALIQVELLLPLFNDVSGKTLTLSDPGSLNIALILAGFTFLISILAGSYPVLFLSAFQPVKALKGISFRQSGRGSRGGVRKILVILQFSTTIVLLIGAFIISNQLEFIRKKDLGFNKNQIVLIPVRGTNAQANFQTFRHELTQHPAVLEATHINHILGETIPAESLLPHGKQLNEPLRIPRLSVDFGFLNTFDIELIAGRDFSEEFATDRGEAVILNEAAVKQIGWS